MKPCITMAGKYAVNLNPDNPVEITANLWLDGADCSDQLELDNAREGKIIFTRSAIITAESTIKLILNINAVEGSRGSIVCSLA